MNGVTVSPYESGVSLVSGAIILVQASTVDSHIHPLNVSPDGSCPHADDVEGARELVDPGLALERKPWPSPYQSTVYSTPRWHSA